MAGHAAAKSYSLPAADIAVQIQPDGSLRVREQITFDFSGSFSGAYRDIPLRRGESIDRRRGQRGRRRSTGPAANTELGGFGLPGHLRRHAKSTTGSGSSGTTARATSGGRSRSRTASAASPSPTTTSSTSTCASGETSGRRRLGYLTAAMLLPRRRRSALLPRLGQPGVGARASSTHRRARRRFRRVERPGAPVRRVPRRLPAEPAHVDRRRAGPPRATGSRDPRRGARLAARVRARPRADRRREEPPRPHAALLLLLGVGPGAAAHEASSGSSTAASGRRATTASTSRRRRRTPSPHSCRRSLRQETAPGSNEFTATLFDLIRRGRYKSTPVTTERSVWGGLRHEDVADLQLSRRRQEHAS